MPRFLFASILAAALVTVLALASQLSFSILWRCPASLTAVIYPDSGGTLASTYRTLTTCPHIKSLDLSLLRSGCVIDPSARWAFDFQRGDRFPALKRLRIRGYRFDALTRTEMYSHMLHWWVRGTWAWAWGDAEGMKQPRQPPPNGQNLRRWLKAMDWSQLKSLEIVEPRESFASIMRGELSGLQELKIVEPPQNWRCDDIKRFWKDSGGVKLKRLAMVNFSQDPDEIEEYVNSFPGLESLELRNYEMQNYGASKIVLSANQIERVGKAHPGLRELSLDIDRNGTWPEEVFEAVASIPQLEVLSLWLEVGSDDSRRHDARWSKIRSFRKPIADIDSVEEVFQNLRARKSGKELQRMTIFLGDIGRDYGWGLRSTSWLEDQGRKFECDVIDKYGQRKPQNISWCKEDISVSKDSIRFSSSKAAWWKSPHSLIQNTSWKLLKRLQLLGRWMMAT